MNVIVNRTSANLEYLDWEIRSIINKQFLGASFDGERVILYLTDTATNEQVAAAVRLAEAHDPLKLTPAQQEATDRAAQLEVLRSQNSTALDLTAYAASAPEIRRLAEKIAWLELEIATRR